MYISLHYELPSKSESDLTGGEVYIDELGGRGSPPTFSSMKLFPDWPTAPAEFSHWLAPPSSPPANE